MSGVGLLLEAESAGLSVEVDGDRLVIRGRPDAEPAARRLLARKPEVMAALADRVPEVRQRVEAMAGQVPERGAVPVLVVKTHPEPEDSCPVAASLMVDAASGAAPAR